jgi:hypothetical protein
VFSAGTDKTGEHARNMSKSFQTLYCEHYQCSAQEFEQRVFRECLYRHALPLAPLFASLDPCFFLEDLSFIRDVGHAASRSEVISELNRFFGRNMRERNWFRKALGIRVSGKRVLRLYRALFRGQDVLPPEPTSLRAP